MAAIPGTIRVTGPIAPTDTTDVYASHMARWGQGGVRSVADKPARNAITTERREAGMLVFTLDTSEYWRLLPAPWDGTNADWVLFTGGGGGGGDPTTYEEDSTGVTLVKTVGTRETMYVEQTAAVTTLLWAAPVLSDVIKVRNNSGTGPSVVNGNGKTIDGAATILLADDESVELAYNGTEWISF
jgi:hypothetical protein